MRWLCDQASGGVRMAVAAAPDFPTGWCCSGSARPSGLLRARVVGGRLGRHRTGIIVNT
jgi:hypothetical protein